MASPWAIERGEHVTVVFKAFPKSMHPKMGPLWDALEGTFQQWITRKGEEEKSGFVLRVKWRLEGGLSEVDQRVSLDDVLMLGVVGQVSLVAGKSVPLPQGMLADDGMPVQRPWSIASSAGAPASWSERGTASWYASTPTWPGMA